MTPDHAHSVTIAIPTHNRAAQLARALESLEHLRVPAGVDVDLVVVANACTDDTAAVVRAAGARLPFPVQVVEDPVPNESRARNAGARAARGQIVAMVDDDVWVEPDWLTGLLAVYDECGADLVAGRVVLWWEAIARPAWFTAALDHVLPHLDLGDSPVELPEYWRAVGANYSFRRAVFEELDGFRPGLGRTGGVLLGGSDTDFSARAVARGHRMFYAPRAVVKHWVPPERVTPEYICGVAFHHGRSSVFIRPTLSLGAGVATVLQGVGAMVQRALRELGARLQGDRAGVMKHRMRRKTAQGQVVGAIQRLTGRSPVVPADAGQSAAL